MLVEDQRYYASVRKEAIYETWHPSVYGTVVPTALVPGY